MRSGVWQKQRINAGQELPWVKPVLVAQIEFVGCTGQNHLRHSKFVTLRDDKKATDVKRE